MKMRTESDSFGPVEIPADRYWGGQTQRAIAVFEIDGPRMPRAICRVFGLQKAAAARANLALGVLDAKRAGLILQAAEELWQGAFDDHFPLPVFQTGSGTQTNMNANEVLANRANELDGQPLGTRNPVHPNDHVNRSQSSNDSFPTVMQITAVLALSDQVLPALDQLHDMLDRKAREFVDVVRIGRTHLNDAVPVMLGQNFAAYARQIDLSRRRIGATLPDLRELPQGGTAAGSGLNAPRGFDVTFCAALSDATGQSFTASPVKVEGMAAHDAIVAASASLEGLAIGLIHILNDLRLLASGPRAGLGELRIPDDGLTSSIMPGKRNATLAEALIQVCQRSIGNHATVAWAGASGLFELNVSKPVLIHAFVESCDALASGIRAFTERSLTGLEADRARMSLNVEMTLMVATALAPRLGYDRVAELTRTAEVEGLSLREACLNMNLLSPEDFDLLINPARMARGDLSDPAGNQS
ncbi:class II fumarate hydratase [Tabrizicola sp. WMC-M-20]|nr:class II fumarate hydratase [Tabrizicola sp. WMC-M-20]